MNQKEKHIIIAPTKDLLPGELKSFFNSANECKAILEGRNGERLTSLIILSDKAFLFCKGTNGFTINEIQFRNKPYITSDKDPAGFWTIYVSASPRHFQLEALSQDDAAQLTIAFEEAVDDYLKDRPSEIDEELREIISTRKAEEKEGQCLLDDLTQKWKKDGPVKKTGLEWLPSLTTTYRVLVFLLILGTVHSVLILFTSSYSLSVDRQALIKLAEKSDTWANKQLALNLDSETNNIKIMESLNVIEANINESTGNILFSQLHKVTLPKAKKKILTILINFGMVKQIESIFFQSYSLSEQKEIIELTGEVDSVQGTLMLHRIYNKTGNDLRGMLLIVLARKSDIHFLVESYKKGSPADRSNCIEAALSLPQSMNKTVLKDFLKIEKDPIAIEEISRLLGD